MLVVYPCVAYTSIVLLSPIDYSSVHDITYKKITYNCFPKLRQSTKGCSDQGYQPGCGVQIFGIVVFFTQQYYAQ